MKSTRLEWKVYLSSFVEPLAHGISLRMLADVAVQVDITRISAEIRVLPGAGIDIAMAQIDSSSGSFAGSTIM